MSDLIKPPILDDTGQTIKTKLTAILQSLQNIALDLSSYMKKGVDYVTAGNKLSTIGLATTIEGGYNASNGDYAHVEGHDNIGHGEACHVEGVNNRAYKNRCHVEGYGTYADSHNQHVEGKYNIIDSNNVYAHIIGNGTGDNNRSNAFAVTWEGDVFAGRSNGIDTTNEPYKLPTSQDVVSYLNSNFAKCYYNRAYTGDANNLDSYVIALVSCSASNTINLPTMESYDWYNIFSMCFNGNPNYVIQIAFRINHDTIYKRYKGGSWSEWTTI